MRYGLALLLLLAVTALRGVASSSPRAGILVVYVQGDHDMQARAQHLIDRLKEVRAQSDAPTLPMLAYYFDNAAERRECQDKLGIGGADLPFVGVVGLDEAGQPTSMLARWKNVKDAPDVSAAVFKKARLELASAHPSDTPQNLPAEIKNPKDGSILVLVPGGTFVMGADDGDDEEKPAHKVSLSPYYISKYLVTNAQYKRFVDETHSASRAFLEDARKWGDDAPVVHVSWTDSVAYCRWAGLRLPTEAEWEKAARGPSPRQFPWGNQFIASNAVFKTDGAKPVGTHPAGASPYGCLDMAGNVWEWCSSLFKPYPYSPTDGRESLGASGRRVLRGGSWNDGVPALLRACSRQGTVPDKVYEVIGFRTARTP